MVIAQRKLDYPQHPRERGHLLPLLIGASLFFHALGFYAFHVVYPQPQPFFARSASITLASPERDWSPRRQQWLRQEDPSLLTRYRSHTTAQPVAMPGYKPLWETQPPRLQQPAPLDILADIRGETPAYQPLDLLRPPHVPPAPSAAGKHSLAQTAQDPQPSRLTFNWTGQQTQRQLREPVTLDFALPSNSALRPASFTVAVDPAGRVRHVLTQQTSNIDAIDKAARRVLLNLRFQPHNGAPDELNWAVATFYWGAADFSPDPTPDS
jgi:hypothetical protein